MSPARLAPAEFSRPPTDHSHAKLSLQARGPTACQSDGEAGAHVLTQQPSKDGGSESTKRPSQPPPETPSHSLTCSGGREGNATGEAGKALDLKSSSSLSIIRCHSPWEARTANYSLAQRVWVAPEFLALCARQATQ